MFSEGAPPAHLSTPVSAAADSGASESLSEPRAPQAVAADGALLDAAADYACILHRLRREEDRALAMYEAILTKVSGYTRTSLPPWLYTH